MGTDTEKAEWTNLAYVQDSKRLLLVGRPSMNGWAINPMV